MAKYRSPLRFSRSFGLSGRDLSNLHAFDPVLGSDTHLFIDPISLRHSVVSEISTSGSQRLDTFFQNIYRLIRASTQQQDIPWVEARRRLTFHEIAGTCLGYGAGIAGSGWGTYHSDQLIDRAKKIIDLGVEDPHLFLLIGLFSEGIGPDRMSDMVTNIILQDLISFTQRVCAGLSIPTEGFQIAGAVHGLPRNLVQRNRVPVLLVPNDILRQLPIANSVEDIWKVAAENEATRERMNTHLGELWGNISKRKKSDVLGALLRDPAYVQDLITTLLSQRPEPYDMVADDKGFLFWTDLAYTIANSDPKTIDPPAAKTLEGLQAVVTSIIDQFRFLIEHRDLWKVLHEAPSRKTEKTAQSLFFAVAYAYIKANNLDITPEADTGNGPVDFKFTQGDHPKILVELKLSKGKVEHGYLEQMPAYMQGEQADLGHYIVLDVGSLGSKWQRVQAAHTEDPIPSTSIWLIDANFRSSASRR